MADRHMSFFPAHENTPDCRCDGCHYLRWLKMPGEIGYVAPRACRQGHRVDMLGRCKCHPHYGSYEHGCDCRVCWPYDGRYVVETEWTEGPRKVQVMWENDGKSLRELSAMLRRTAMRYSGRGYALYSIRELVQLPTGVQGPLTFGPDLYQH